MIAFRPAKRSEAKPLIGLYAESGAGKTLSALLLARGFVGPEGRIGMIETESGRGEVYADDPRLPGGYAVLPLRETFSPEVYGEAIQQAEKESFDALIIDSASHEWDAVGGVRHMAAMAEEEGKKGMLVWQAAKMAHQRHFMLPLLTTPIPLVILCMRARYPMEERKGVPEKDRWQRSEWLVPYQSDTILFEMFVHGWIDRPQHRFHGTKYSREDLRGILRDNEPITVDTGQRLAAWASGGTTAGRVVSEPTAVGTGQPTAPGATSGGGTGGTRSPLDEYLDQIGNVKTPAQRLALWERIKPTWGSFLAGEQKRLLEANDAAKRRVGG
jgi:RecA/RadA recombinase